MIPFAFEIIRVTGSAVRRVLGIGPGNIAADTIAVAAGTAWIVPVIPRVVPPRAMTEAGRRPAIRDMTDVALFGRVQMPPRFGGRAVAGRVAGVAIADTAGIVSPAAAGEGCGGMTGGTIQAGRYMGRYGIHHTCRRITIVAGSAIVDDAGMIEGCRYEATGIVADTTVLVSVDMFGFLGCSETSVMTGGAVIHDAGMIEGSWQKARGYVIIAAVTVGRHVEVVLAGGSNTIMTGGTVIHDTLVLEPGVGKGGRGMAHRAILGGWDVVRVDLRLLAGGGNAIMAGGAVIHDTGVTEHRRLEAAAGHVADPAILGCRNVAGVHTFCRTRSIG